LIEKIKQLRSEGIKCYLATNQEKYRTKYMRETMDFENIFDGVFSSAELECKKPEKEFFQKVLDSLEINGEEVLFFDDDQRNINGAKSSGIKSFLYVGFDKLEEIIGNWISAFTGVTK